MCCWFNHLNANIEENNLVKQTPDFEVQDKIQNWSASCSEKLYELRQAESFGNITLNEFLFEYSHTPGTVASCCYIKSKLHANGNFRRTELMMKSSFQQLRI